MDPARLWQRSTHRDDNGACAVCKKTTKNRCTACKTVYYCSKDHQKLHWKSDHKINCSMIELAVDPVIGRHYIAKRRIEPGEIVLREKTLLVTFSTGQTESPLCLNCYTVVKKETQRICEKCGWWPLCSNCTEHGAECEFTIKYGKFENVPGGGKWIRRKWTVPNCIMIGAIRVMAMRENNPEVYSKILAYEDHGLKWRTMSRYIGDKCLGKIMRGCFNVRNFRKSEIAKIARILHINGHEYRTGVAGIAEKVAFIEHSCLPNCTIVVPDKVKGSSLIWAIREIAPGENISICYFDPTDGTMLRKQSLLEAKFFECTCRRCKDPTEFGTMFNAMKCGQEGCEGDMLPPSFVMTGRNFPDFVCLECKATVSWVLVTFMQKVAMSRLCQIDEVDVNGYKGWIKDHEKVLHQNHYLMVKAKLALANVLGFDAYVDAETTVVPMNEVDEKIQLSEEMAKILEILTPGYTVGRGKLMYGIAVSFSKKIKVVEDDPIELAPLLPKAREAFKEVCKMLCYEEKASEEGQMATQSMQMLSMLMIIKCLEEENIGAKS